MLPGSRSHRSTRWLTSCSISAAGIRSPAEFSLRSFVISERETYALVLSVDEKPSIQALERATGYVQTSSGKIIQELKSTYKRHGTVNLFAAWRSPPGS
jgi:hypothetical protein